MLFDADGDQDLDVVTVTRDGAVNLTTATSLPQEGQGCTIRFPDNLRANASKSLGQEPQDHPSARIPSGGGFQSSSPRGARPRAQWIRCGAG